MQEAAGDSGGIADTTRRVGEVALALAEYDTANSYFERAVHTDTEHGNNLGAAEGLRGLADIAFARGELDRARSLSEQALDLYRATGNTVGQARATQRLGDAARAQSDHEAALTSYEHALALQRASGDVVGELETTFRLASLATEQGDLRRARSLLEQTLSSYRALGDPHAVGQTLLSLARLASGDEQQRHVRGARSCWLSIGRDDLVRELDKEFGKPYVLVISSEPRLDDLLSRVAGAQVIGPEALPDHDRVRVGGIDDIAIVCALADPSDVIAVTRLIQDVRSAFNPVLALFVGTAASISPAEASIGDILVPPVVIDGSSARPKRWIGASSEVLRVARSLTAAPWRDEAITPRPVDDGEVTRVRFGDVAIGTTATFDGMSRREQGLPVAAVSRDVHAFLDAMSAVDGPPAHGVILGISDSARAFKVPSDWSPYVASVACQFAAALAIAFPRTAAQRSELPAAPRQTEAPFGYSIPELEIPAGSLLYRAHYHAFGALEVTRLPSAAMSASVLYTATTPATAFADLLVNAGLQPEPGTVVPLESVRANRISTIRVVQPLHVVDFTSPNERLQRLGLDAEALRNSQQLQPMLDSLTERGYDGLLLPPGPELAYNPLVDSSRVIIFAGSVQRLEVTAVSALDAELEAILRATNRPHPEIHFGDLFYLAANVGDAGV